MQLCGRDLPWVQHATHLGHELHQMCNMEFDANVKRAQFIESSVKIQESFGFAQPNEILEAIHTYAGKNLLKLRERQTWTRCWLSLG
jgi:hypothetical protein